MSDTPFENRENIGENQKYHTFISEKTQKITEALYRVTDLFPEEEPLKWLLRKIGLEVFNQISALTKNFVFHENTQSLRALFGALSRLLSVLELASAGGFIAQINFEVLQREYSALRDFIENKKEKLFLPPFEMPHGNFLLEEKTMPDSGALLKNVKPPENISDKGHSNGQIKTSNSQNNGQRHNDNRSPEQESVENNSQTNLISQEKENKNNAGRHETIINFLKNNDRVSVSQIASIFNGSISEKTIQRELLSMSEKGILNKEGDKRWRRYSLKN